MIGTADALRRTRAVYALVGLAALTGAMVGCSSDDDITNPVGAVTAIRDQSFNFTTLHTFAMPDTVIQFAPKTGTPLVVPRTYDQVAINEVRANLIARGYTEVTDPKTTRPDFIVLIGASATTNYDVYATYPWYGYWGYYAGWGWYAPGFGSDWTIIYPWYPTVGVTAYDRGTLVVTIVPTLSVNPLATTAPSITAAWAGVASALLNGNITSTTVSNAIDQMFQLSPYLVNTTSTASRLK